MNLVEAWNSLRYPEGPDDTIAIEAVRVVYEAALALARRCGSRDPEDLASLVMVALLRRRRRQFEREAQVRAYLNRALRNMAIDRGRKNKSLPDTLDENDAGATILAEPDPDSVEPQADALLSELRIVAREIAETLKRRPAREAFLAYFEELLDGTWRRCVTSDELARRETGLEDPGQEELRLARQRLNTNHYRTRRRLLEHLMDQEQAACLTRDYERAERSRLLMALVEQLRFISQSDAQRRQPSRP